jgi:hypothetical protein
MAFSAHIQEAYTESFAGIDKLVDGQINKARSQHLDVKVHPLSTSSYPN